MKKDIQTKLTRRKFVAATVVTGLGLGLRRTSAADAKKPALLGGKPACTQPFPTWPVFDEADEGALKTTLRSGNWFRGSGRNVTAFEAEYSKLIGAKYCIATNSGTSALIVSLNVLGVGPGDEVILPPYTFVACVNAILMLGAVPVFVDTDRNTFQIDASKIEAAITERTAAIMPVHLGGNPADLDSIKAIARKHNLPIVEDACQAHLAEWRGQKVGTYGETGCFSFQASKNLTAGDGGAILTNNEEIAEKCFSAQNNGRGRKPAYAIRGANLRMSEFHGGLLLTQMTRLPAQAKTRDDNGAYLTKALKEIRGIKPAEAYEGCTRNAYHLYMFRYDPAEFANLPRAKFLSALAAEGIRCSAGYGPLNKEQFILQTLRSRGFQRAYPRELLDAWIQRNSCPENDRLCEESLWFTQNVLLAKREAMDQIIDAVRKIHTHAGDLAKA